MGFLRILTAAVGAGLSLINGGTGGVDQASAALGVLPTATALQQIRKNAADTAWEAFTPGAASGDVVGPASAVDSAICRFDTTTGKLIQDSKFSVGDAGAANFFDNSGGNARGANAVDLQTSRGVATQVANGANACIPGGSNNTASGANSVAMGTSSTASGARAMAFGNGVTANTTNAVAMGSSSTASGVSSFAMGNISVASANYATSFGNNNTASAQAAFACGESANADKLGMWAIGFNDAAVGGAGFIQAGMVGYMASLATASQTELTLNGVGATYLTLVDGDCYDCYFTLLARQSSGVFAAWAEVQFTIQRTGATTSIVGTALAAIIPARTDAGASLLTSTLDIEADDGNDRLAIKVTGADATATYYLGVLRFRKVKKA